MGDIAEMAVTPYKPWQDPAYREIIGDYLARVAALDFGPRTFLLTPGGLEPIGCSRLDLAVHFLREQGLLPWPEGGA